MDDFQRAAVAAERHFKEAAWAAMSARDKAQAIYVELRRIDAERVAAGPSSLSAAREGAPGPA